MRVDLNDEMEDQFEMSLEDVSDPVVPVEPPPTTSHATAGEERERGVANADGRRAYARWLPVPDEESDGEASGAVGQGHPVANPVKED